METWYQTGGYGENLINPVTVVKSTDKTVTIREMGWGGRETERRSAIRSSYYRYFRTWEEAHAHLLASADSKVIAARRAVEEAGNYFNNVLSLKKPA